MANDLVKEQDLCRNAAPFFFYIIVDGINWLKMIFNQKSIDFMVYIGNYLLCYPDKEIICNPSDKSEVDKKIDYLNQMREECETAGIEIIFIHISYSYRPDLQRVANGICQYEGEQGVLCINYMNMNTEIDYDIILCASGHLNPTGTRSMTDEIGKLLSEYGITDYRGDSDTWQWEQAYEEYIDFRINKIKEIQDIMPYLMTINDPDLKLIVKFEKVC